MGRVASGTDAGLLLLATTAAASAEQIAWAAIELLAVRSDPHGAAATATTSAPGSARMRDSA